MSARILVLFVFSLHFSVADIAGNQTKAAGDFDSSGTVDFSDFVAFAAAYGSTQSAYDLDRNGWRSNWRT